MVGIQHVALHVADVQASVHFYQNILGFKPLPRPAFDFPGAWFQIGDYSELHLIGGRNMPVHSGSRGNHFALSHPDLEILLQHIQRHQISYEGIKTRPDGVRQLFIFDPDGHCIEFNSAI